MNYLGDILDLLKLNIDKYLGKLDNTVSISKQSYKVTSYEQEKERSATDNGKRS